MNTNKFAELNTFVTVVDSKGIGEAARRFGISKSVVSERIKSLEKRLKISLFERGNKLRITHTGQQLYERAVRILDELANAEEAIQSPSADFSGDFRVATPTVFGLRCLSPILSQFAKRHPDLRLAVEASDNWASLQDSNFDLAIRFGTPPNSSLIAKPIVTSRQVICASPDYLARRGTPLHPRDLVSHDGLLYAHHEDNGHWHLLADGRVQMFRIHARLRSDSGFQLLDAARTGLGLAMLPTFLLAESIVAGELRVVLEDFTPDGPSISAIYRGSRRGSTKIRALVQFIGERLGNPPSWDIAIRDVQANHGFVVQTPEPETISATLLRHEKCDSVGTLDLDERFGDSYARA